MKLSPEMSTMATAVRAVLSLHCKEAMEKAQIIGPYCAECTSPIDGGPELYPCMTVKAVLDATSHLARMGAMKARDLNSSHTGKRISLEFEGTSIEGEIEGICLMGESGGAYYDDADPDEGDPAAGKVLNIGHWQSPLLPLDLEVHILD